MKIETDKYKIHCGDCYEVLKSMPDNSVDAVVTDPPYGLSFMGKKWDYDVPKMEIWQECLRVLKPGGHLLAFAGTRTQHRMACRIEDAGFEIRDMIAWVYGSGFPKSLNIGKAIDRELGAEREVIGHEKNFGTTKLEEGKVAFGDYEGKWEITKGNSQWEGWGTALKPALEPITVARKPITEKNIALNVLKWGTGGINIDECRIEVDAKDPNQRPNWRNHSIEKKSSVVNFTGTKRVPLTLESSGRFPSNFIHDGSEEVMAGFPESDHIEKRTCIQPGTVEDKFFSGKKRTVTVTHPDGGSAARFFYCAKASPSERNEGLEGFEAKRITGQVSFLDEGGIDNKTGEPRNKAIYSKNFHPTVKPIKLMQYLITLVTPADGIVLDPFMGSGSTGVAAMKLKRKFIGIEMNDEYFAIAKARIKKALCPGEIFKALPN